MSTLMHIAHVGIRCDHCPRIAQFMVFEEGTAYPVCSQHFDDMQSDVITPIIIATPIADRKAHDAARSFFAHNL